MPTHISSQNIKNSFRSLFNVRTTVQQFVGTNVRMSDIYRCYVTVKNVRYIQVLIICNVI